jgi:hypothetical protein
MNWWVLNVCLDTIDHLSLVVNNVSQVFEYLIYVTDVSFEFSKGLNIDLEYTLELK